MIPIKVNVGIAVIGFVLFVGANSTVCQYLNIQHHLDFGKDRHYFTNTLEGLAFDDWGAWFGFIDVDHKSAKSKTAPTDWHVGAQLIYFELNRYFSVGKWMDHPELSLWDVTVQYNDSDAGFIPYAYLLGISRNQVLPSFSDAHLEFLLRQEQGQELGWQLTGVWFKSFQLFKQDWQMLGYFDWWKNDHGIFFMAEPQLVVRITGNRFWMGTEWEINVSQDFDETSINPTLFLRYDF